MQMHRRTGHSLRSFYIKTTQWLKVKINVERIASVCVWEGVLQAVSAFVHPYNRTSLIWGEWAVYEARSVYAHRVEKVELAIIGENTCVG